MSSTNVGARWQAEMEDHLKGVRERNRVLVEMASNDPRFANNVAAMQAHALAALTLAVANVGDDIEAALSRVAEKIGELA